MERQVTLKDPQIKELIEFYENKKESLQERMTELRNEIKDVDAIIEPLKESIKEKIEAPNELKQRDIFEKPSDYDKKSSKAKKSESILREFGSELTIRGIGKIMWDKEPYLFANDKAFARSLTQLSATLGVKARAGKVFSRALNDNEAYEYSLLKWAKDD